MGGPQRDSGSIEVAVPWRLAPNAQFTMSLGTYPQDWWNPKTSALKRNSLRRIVFARAAFCGAQRQYASQSSPRHPFNLSRRSFGIERITGSDAPKDPEICKTLY